MHYSLDTNVVIALMAGKGAIRDRVTSHEPGTIGVSAIVLHELMFGAYNSDRVDENLANLAGLTFPILRFDEADAKAAGAIRATLKRQGRPIGPFDMLIAGQALARGLVIVTANVGEFVRVEGLRVEDWTQPPGP